MRKFFTCSLLVIALIATSLPLPVSAGTETIETRSGVPRFTLDEAILTALQRNPEIQRARQEIERTKGLYI